MKRPAKAQVEEAVKRILGDEYPFAAGRCRKAFRAGWTAALQAEHAAGEEYVGRKIFRNSDSPTHQAKVLAYVGQHLIVRYPGCVLLAIHENEFKKHWTFFG